MAEEVYLNSQDIDIQQFVPDEVFENIDAAREAIATLISFYGRKDSPLVFPIILNTGQNIGYVQAVPISIGWEVGYHIAKAYTSCGYATEAVQAFLLQIMPYLGITEICGICHEDNIASYTVLEKCGFVLEFSGEAPYHEGIHPIRRYIYST